MTLNDEDHLVRKITTKEKAPYSQIKLSTLDNKKHKTSRSLLDTGADVPVISHRLALELGAKITPTKSRARDAGNRELPLAGECILKFSCTCEHHRCKIKKTRKCLIFPKMGNTEVIIPYDLSVELGLIEVKCSDTKNHATQRFDVSSVELDEQELPGVDLTEEPPDYSHLSERMKSLAKKFPTVLKDSLHGAKPFKDQVPKEIDIKEGAVPVYRDNIRRTPAHLRDTAKNYIKELVDQQIIEQQPNISNWCSQGFFTSKKGSVKPRFVVDYVPLNKEIIRPHWPFTDAEFARKILPPQAGYFIAIDLVKGYFQCELPEASRDLTTFICEDGRFRFRRFPMGLSSSSDVFNRCADHLMRNIDKSWFVKVVDDILIWGKDKEECYSRFTKILETLEASGVIASLSKIQEGTKVEFCALTISTEKDNGNVIIAPSEEKV